MIPGLLNRIADFEAAVIDRTTGQMRDQFQPNSTIGGPGDKVHPNRAGYEAMANAVDIKLFAPAKREATLPRQGCPAQ
jgi:lysophospholipase L1-like esterase